MPSKAKKMITRIAFAWLLIFTITNTGYAGNDVERRNARRKNLFAFKTTKDFKGAQVAIYAANGDLITQQVLVKKKMIIDFCDAHAGTYTIRVSNDSTHQEFQYVKNK